VSTRAAAKGHEDALPPHRPNAGYLIGKETAACARGSGRDAPKADLAAASPAVAPLSLFAIVLARSSTL
jgi:hypothetical protein